MTRSRRRLAIALVAALPLHTVFLSAWISWKPFLGLLAALALIDLVAAGGRWPWSRRLTYGLLALLGLVGAGVFVTESLERFSQLLFAIAVGGGVMLVTERTVRLGDGRHVVHAVYWSGAAMAVTAVVLSLVIVGAFGAAAVDGVNDIPGVFRVAKPAYLETGFLALTNWHQDPGYAAAWMNLWAMLIVGASVSGALPGRWWHHAVVVGGLGFGTFMTMARSGWLGLVIGLGLGAGLLVWRGGITVMTIVRLALVSGVTGALLVGAVWVADRDGIGGDLDDQLSFRIEQNLTLGTVELENGDGSGVADVRATVWPYYVDAFTERPLTGLGLGTGWAAPGIQEPHNLGLQLAGESGVLGVVGFLVLFGVIVWTGSGVLAGAALLVAMMPAAFQTLLFEPTWWFAAGLFSGEMAFKKAPATVDN